MGLTPPRLLDYFTKDELKFVLSTINEIQSGTREELIERLLVEWPAHNKKWWDLLQFLAKTTMSQICKDYNLGHAGLRNSLEKRIRWELRSQTKNKVEKDSKQPSHPPEISPYKFLYHPHNRRDWSKVGVIVTIVAIVLSFLLK